MSRPDTASPPSLALPPAHAFHGDRDALVSMSCYGLSSQAPAYSARYVLWRWQRLALLAVVVSAVIGLILVPWLTAIIIMTGTTIAYITALGYRLLLFRMGARGGHLTRVTDEEALAVPEAALPSYTVLVPVFKEPLVAELVARLERLDYPRDRLDIRLLLEADDDQTVQAASVLEPRPHLTIVHVPPHQPRTKPKACNFGFLTATGQMCTIYDAEDEPDPLQLRRAVIALHRLGPQYACIQAQLGFYNSRQNLLTRWFTLDYGAWFGTILPGLVALGAPVPLGGTSNHFRSDVLRQVGAWDPWNVTEDADLGLRLHRAGYKVGVLASVTLEEANPDPINWVRQRSRWYKGYLQTFLVHMRQPRLVSRQLGARALAGLIIFVAGTPVLSAINGVLWALTAMWFSANTRVVAELFPAAIYYPGMICLILGNLAVMYMNLFTVRQMDRPDLLLAAVLSPVYWILMWLAAVKAALQLITKPSYWEKTAHGLHQSAGQAGAPVGGAS
ncbi:glycosyltransferase family 2 protein [Actinomyces slackii]|uniref:Cellulose synthase catalytic subunit [UDP-forming] n=1 Tax=Actinomyces slackii TaxID=52774 RepID=A0A3S4TD49_9ACTO|nr:glycosyltransferase family 2 protein [Actinomyces slackii]VEG75137.1 Cellulose synthase catalytic subunit [UDP-forming] [Actinomyces slackii]